jgi:hypothetical protein
VKELNEKQSDKVTLQFSYFIFFLSKLILTFAQAEISDDLIKEFSYGARGNLCPIAAVMGGTLAQEVLKVICLWN